MSWREERRLDEAARAEQARRDAVAAAEVEALRTRIRVEAHQTVAAQQDQIRRRAAMDRQEARAAARQRRAVRVLALRSWASAHLVDLLIYPLALVSAVMAVPAMAEFGREIYGGITGYALFCITELGMWAFALAVQVTQRRFPDRPVWALQVGVWAFAGVAFGLNALHGLRQSWVAGVVMGVGSIAGVIAHQLVTAAPRRGRAERDEARLARRMARKIARVRRSAVRSAVAEIDRDGNARLVFAPGRYALTGRGLKPSAGESPRPSDPPAKKRRRQGRKLLADYVRDARASWSPGVEITPAWARRATGCSAGLSVKVARALREDLANQSSATLTNEREAA
ncbi:hypothetical protein [Actinophytocola xanthii]|uniref:DUF2637 domain-containing protein n=1 Tax=Actinophytocola xanthii TaxID=1912961 RepID=A0A1Q8CSR3_9PSEU|nr:hypothetical protein [Actinophytocola xanthii]OLF17405.1 hypothetical protein BU204_11560 [Actinophytocola xanthii]